MSTTHRPAPITPLTTPLTTPSSDQPTATFPTGQWLADQAAIEQAHRERLADLWEDAAPTELLPVVGPAEPAAGPGAPGTAAPGTAAGTAFPRVSTLPEPTSGRVGVRTPSPRTKGPRRCHPRQGAFQHPVQHPVLRRALAGILIAVALLTGLQLYAAAGISSARQAALQSARESAGAHAYSTPSDAAPSRPEQAAPEHEGGQQSPMSGQTPAPATMSDRTSAAPMSGQTDTQPEWVTQDSGAPYVRTNPHASPLDLPRCTTSPTTPMPCLAHVSADSRHAVILEEDGSLTGLVAR